MSDPKAWWGARVPTDYTFPKALQAEAGAETVSMVPLDFDEEERAAQVCGSNFQKLAYLLARLSIVKIGGKPVEQDGLEVQRLVASSSKIRKLLIAARAKLNDPEETEVDSFLGSATVVV